MKKLLILSLVLGCFGPFRIQAQSGRIVVRSGSIDTQSNIQIDGSDAILPQFSNTDLTIGANGANNDVIVQGRLLRVNEAGMFNNDRQDNNFCVMPNTNGAALPAAPGPTPTPPGTMPTPLPSGARSDRPLFFVNTAPNPRQDYEIENSIEMWGTAESYWFSKFYAQQPRVEAFNSQTNQTATWQRRGMSVYPISFDVKHNYIDALNMTPGLPDRLAYIVPPNDPEYTTEDIQTGFITDGTEGDLPYDPIFDLVNIDVLDEAWFYGDVVVYEAKQTFYNYNRPSLQEEIEIDRTEALEPTPLMKTEMVEVEKTEFGLNAESGEVEQVVRKVREPRQIATGRTGWKLKEGVRLDKTTGKFFRTKTREEVEAHVEAPAPIDPPAWMRSRLPQ